MGGNLPLGYDASQRTLVINPAEAETVRCIFALYRQLGCVRRVKQEADRLDLRTKCSMTANGERLAAGGGGGAARCGLGRTRNADRDLDGPLALSRLSHVSGDRPPTRSSASTRMLLDPTAPAGECHWAACWWPRDVAA